MNLRLDFPMKNENLEPENELKKNSKKEGIEQFARITSEQEYVNSGETNLEKMRKSRSEILNQSSLSRI